MFAVREDLGRKTLWYGEGVILIFYLCISFFILWVTGWGPQWLSYRWYLSDGRIRKKSLTWTHVLHLGIFKRLATLIYIYIYIY